MPVLFALASLCLISTSVFADPPGAPGYDQASGYHHDYYANGGTSGATTTAATVTTTTTTTATTTTSTVYTHTNDSDNDSSTYYHYVPTVNTTSPYSVTPTDPRDSSPSSSTISIVTGIRNATMAAVNAAQVAAIRVVNTTYSLVKPHYDAYQAGVTAENREIAHIVSAMDGSQFDDQSLQRANDNGVYNHYQSQGLDPVNQLVPSGPMQRITLGTTRELTPAELTDIRGIDQLYRAGKIQVYAPGDITPENGVRILGPAYNLLTRQQRVGLENSVLAQGRVDGAAMELLGMPAALASQTAGFTDPYDFGGAVTGSLVVMNSVNPPVNYSDTIIHELQHAADSAMTNIAITRMTNSTLTQSQRNIAMSAAQAGVLVGNITEGAFDAVAVNSNYVNSFKELRGYSATPANMETLAQHIAHGTTTDSSVTFQEIPIDEARIMAEGLVRSTTLQQIDSAFNALLNDMGN